MTVRNMILTVAWVVVLVVFGVVSGLATGRLAPGPVFPRGRALGAFPGVSSAGGLAGGRLGSVAQSLGCVNCEVGSVAAAGLVPRELAFVSRTSAIYATGGGPYLATVISGTNNSTSSIVGEVPLPKTDTGSWDVVFDAGMDRVYISAVTGTGGTQQGEVFAVSASNDSVLGMTLVGDGTGEMAMAYDPSTGNIYVADSGSNNVTVIADTTDTVVATIPVGVSPQYAVFDPTNGDIYVSNANSSNVSVISGNTNRVVASIPLPDLSPEQGAYDPGDQYLYFVSRFDSTGKRVAVLDGQTNSFLTNVSGNLSWPGGGVAYDSWNGEIYVQYGESMLGVINGTRLAGNISLNATNWGEGVAFDSSNGDVYVGGAPGAVIPVANMSVSIVSPLGSLPFISSFKASLSSPHLNESVSLDAQVNGGGGAPYRFSYAGLPPGCQSLDSGLLNCTPTSSGTFPVTVTVTDAQGNHSSATLDLAVQAGPQSSIIPGAARVDVNETVTFRTSVREGAPPFSYSYAPSSPAAGCTTSTTGELNCTPGSALQGSSFTVSVRTVDSFGVVNDSTSPPVAVWPALRVSFTVSNRTPLLGQTMALTASAQGGMGPYSYSYLGLPVGCVSVNASSIGCLPTQAGWYNTSVVVTDQNNETTSANVSVHVVFDFNVVSPALVTLGSSFTIRVYPDQVFTGTQSDSPSAGAFNYTYSGLPSGCSNQDAPTLNCTPTRIGNFSISITVRDAEGNSNTHTVSVRVTSRMTSPPSTLLGLPGEDAIYVIGVVVGAVVCVLVVHRYQRSKGKVDGKGKVEDPLDKYREGPILDSGQAGKKDEVPGADPLSDIL